MEQAQLSWIASFIKDVECAEEAVA